MQNERPTIITVICVLMGIGAAFTLPAIFLVGDKLPGWYTPFLLTSAAIGVACMYGLWTMKKWAVFVYSGMFAVSQAVMFATGLWSPAGLIIPVIVIAIMFSNLSKMS